MKIKEKSITALNNYLIFYIVVFEFIVSVFLVVVNHRTSKDFPVLYFHRCNNYGIMLLRSLHWHMNHELGVLSNAPSKHNFINLLF